MQRIAFGRHLQRLDQLAAQREHALRMRPHRHLAVLEFGERARTARSRRAPCRAWCRPPRRVRAFAGTAPCLTPMVASLLGSDLMMLEDARRVRQLRPSVHFALFEQRLARLDRLLLALGDDAEERAVAHHRDHARHRLDRRFVDAFERRAVARRAHHAAVHHAGQAHVLHVRGAAGHLRRDVEARDRLADDLVARRRLRRRLGGRLAVEIDARRRARRS